MKSSINLGLDSKWMIGSASLEVYKSIFNITEENNKCELHADLVDEFLFTELKDELEEILDISNFSPEHPQDKILGPRIIKAYNKLESEKRRNDGFIMLLMGYARSSFEFLKLVSEL